MAEIVPALLDTLNIETIDLLGWSLGGYVAQTVALDRPTRVRRLVIAGSGPGGPDGPPSDPRVAEIAAKVALAEEDIRFLFFTNSRIGQAAARRHFDQIHLGKRSPIAAQTGIRHFMARRLPGRSLAMSMHWTARYSSPTRTTASGGARRRSN
jgi:pimeloyl-ACP methyl ester carboxylesterase